MTTNEPARWLLDVDGVLNAFGKPGWSAAPWKRTVTVPFVYPGQHLTPDAPTTQEFRIRWAPRLLQRIRELRTAGAFELVWCTTWCPEAQLLEQLWSLPELERAWTDDLHGFAAVEAKRAAARTVLAAGRRLIWTDDDAFPKRGPFVDELTATGRALLIKTDARCGLQPPDLDAIEAFAAGGPGSAEVRVSTRFRRPGTAGG